MKIKTRSNGKNMNEILFFIYTYIFLYIIIYIQK